MYVVVRPAIGAIISIKTKDGKILSNDDIEEIQVEPFFPKTVSSVPVLGCTSITKQGKEDALIVYASGRSGKLTKVSVSDTKKKVLPKCDLDLDDLRRITSTAWDW